MAAPSDCLYCGEPVRIYEHREYKSMVVSVTGGPRVVFHRRCREVHRELGRITYEEE